MRRFFAVAILLVAILVIAWNNQVGSNQQYASPAASATTSAIFTANEIVEKNRNADTVAVPKSASVTKLDGSYSPDNETLLIAQLTRAGYIYISSYRAVANRGVAIMAMKGKNSFQPFLTITVDKYGKATSVE